MPLKFTLVLKNLECLNANSLPGWVVYKFIKRVIANREITAGN